MGSLFCRQQKLNMSFTGTELLNTRKHFETLDGLRGIAAIAVVIFHFMEFAAPKYEDSFIGHGYLAVDFFFCLSGFVIAYAYDKKIKGMKLGHFFKLRLIRLHPMVVIGAIIGLLAFVFDPYSNLYQQYGLKETILMFISGSTLIPYPLVKERYFNLFHLNPPTWSLFWEYMANIFYALLFYRLKKYGLLLLTIGAAILLCYEAEVSGYIGVGWSGENFWGGGVRVLYSFLAGMCVYRFKWMIPNRLGFTVISILLLAALLVPYTEPTAPFADPLIVILYFPLIVALGSGISPKGRAKKSVSSRALYPTRYTWCIIPFYGCS
ncbi:acyltransferase family protein [Niabella hibiscisoli]|uniref:acyltransferase family protein n=1 Tax=Niabella hibiscisoli TaxID=1825928 RepID=UPI001F1009A3|nr:acyltransferase [Niabella hibiscisoli]MCH5717737.1 acyltransferase [Niabella hibiscisoli]